MNLKLKTLQNWKKFKRILYYPYTILSLYYPITILIQKNKENKEKKEKKKTKQRKENKEKRENKQKRTKKEPSTVIPCWVWFLFIYFLAISLVF